MNQWSRRKAGHQTCAPMSPPVGSRVQHDQVRVQRGEDHPDAGDEDGEADDLLDREPRRVGLVVAIALRVAPRDRRARRRYGRVSGGSSNAESRVETRARHPFPQLASRVVRFRCHTRARSVRSSREVLAPIPRAEWRAPPNGAAAGIPPPSERDREDRTRQRPLRASSSTRSRLRRPASPSHAFGLAAGAAAEGDLLAADPHPDRDRVALSAHRADHGGTCSARHGPSSAAIRGFSVVREHREHRHQVESGVEQDRAGQISRPNGEGCPTRMPRTTRAGQHHAGAEIEHAGARGRRPAPRPRRPTGADIRRCNERSNSPRKNSSSTTGATTTAVTTRIASFGAVRGVEVVHDLLRRVVHEVRDREQHDARDDLETEADRRPSPSRARGRRRTRSRPVGVPKPLIRLATSSIQRNHAPYWPDDRRDR